MSSPDLAVVFGCAGPVVTPAERAFFRDARPFGFILFGRSCETPDQVAALVAALRESVGRPDAPILIDQEGGRVARMRPPAWRAALPAGRFGSLAATDLDAAVEAAGLNARLIAADLHDAGITVDCAPVLDVGRPETTDAIGDRAFAADPEVVTALGHAACAGFLAGGVLPVVKHLPGHGRARVDSHFGLPRVEADRATLAASDFRPFVALADQPLAMTAHLLFTAVDAERPATQSPTVIEEVIRGEIGFAGLLFSDDISMQALAGDLPTRTVAALAAGCDVVLHCTGNLAEMRAIADRVGRLTPAACDRWARAQAALRAPQPADRAALVARLDALLAA